MHTREALRKTVTLGIDDEIDAALPIEQYVFRTMLRDRRKTHLLEQATQRGRIRRGILDEFKPIGAERIIAQSEGVAGGMWPPQRIVTPASFSCASISDGTYLSPSPIRLALTRRWCTASPTMADTGSDSAKCV